MIPTIISELSYEQVIKYKICDKDIHVPMGDLKFPICNDCLKDLKELIDKKKESYRVW
jgi:hypothetical protein